MSTHTVGLHHETIGSGQPLVVLHGLFGSLSNWRPLARQWSADYQVHAVDLRNHGRSAHSEHFSYRAMAEDLRVWLQSQNLQSIYLLGHSMGGKVAMQFALNHPDVVEKLVVVDMTPRATRPRHEHILNALRSLDLSSAKSRRDLDAQLAPNIPDNEVRQFLLMNIMNDENGGLRWRMNLKSLAENYDEINQAVETQKTFDKPTLFIRGEKSDYICDEDMEAIQRLFISAQIETISGAGHWVHAEAPLLFSQAVTNFLSPEAMI